MSVFDYLRDHALKNVWCTPDQDMQVIIKLAKITGPGGVKLKTRVLWREEYLPDTNSFWNVYQIGQVHPLIFGLFPLSHEWVAFDKTCNEQKMIADIYTDEGINLPRFQTYYKYNEDRNLIVAVKKNPKIPFDFNKDDIYLRVYTNEFFNTLRSDQIEDFIHVEGKVPTTNQQILDLQTTLATYTARDGAVNVFVNGFKKDTIDLITTTPGDIVEFVYDSSIYKVIDFRVGDLLNFHSTLDAKMKYLLHYAGADNGMIDYQDDIDVFMMRDIGNGRQKGLYYHKNSEDAVRNVTHRDYSIVVPYVVNYNSVFFKNQTTAPVLDPDDMYVRLHIRKSGYDRPLVFEHNRIHELYKMQDVDIVKAMLGIDSTVNNWRAEVLEAAGYTEIMRSECKNVTNELVQKAYGYNAISVILGQTPSATYDFSNKKVIDVPYGLQTGATAYEYSADGTLLGWHVHPVGSRYSCVDDNAAYVEMFNGIGTDHLDEYYNATNIPLNPKHSFRVYECRTMGGVPDNKFVDVTDSPNKYGVSSGRLIWLDNSTMYYPMVRTNAKFIAKDMEFMINHGEFKFSIVTLQKRGATWTEWVMHVPMGEIDIFLNGKSLIRDLDYVVRFPEIVIINKEYLVNPATEAQKIHIRHTGFCKPDMTLDEYGDYGFIVHGVLSNNSKYDIRDDKVLRITVDGALKTRSDMVFSEFHTGVSIIDSLNGQPYQVKDVVVPFKGLTREDTYSLRAKSIAVDKAVSDYLTIKIPQPPRTPPSAIVDRYAVVSPFCNRIIYSVDNGIIPIADRVYSDQEVYNLCKPYEGLLKYDPTTEELEVDDRFVIIHPHNLGFVVNFTLAKYRFMEQVVRIYNRNRVTLSPFVVMI